MRMDGMRSECGKDTPLIGPRFELTYDSPFYPDGLRELASPPRTLYVIGNPCCLRVGLSVVGARRATPYGKSCAQRFSALAAQQGITIVSGGARGCDSAAHQGALDQHAATVAVLGGGCDKLYPAQNKQLFQRIIDEGGAIVSENTWDFDPLPYTFRTRNRIIAALSKATLIVEAGLPSGTFSTADDALGLGREVMVVPGAITAPNSKGANRLLFQGALPIVDDESFLEALASLYPQEQRDFMRYQAPKAPAKEQDPPLLFDDPLVRAIATEPLDREQIYTIATQYCGDENPSAWAAVRIEEAQDAGLIALYPDGSYGPFL